MPTLPTTIGAQQAPRVQRRVWAVDNTAVLRQDAKNAQQLQNLGADVGDFAKQREKDNTRDAMLNATDRENYAKQRMNTLLYGDDENEGLYGIKGAQALGSKEKFDDAYAQIKEEALNGVENTFARTALEDSMESMYTSNGGGLQRYMMGERRSYANSLMVSRKTTGLDRLGLEYNNPELLQETLTEATGSTIAQNKLNGFAVGDDSWNLALKESTSDVYSTALNGALSEAQRNNDHQLIIESKLKYDGLQAQGKFRPAAVDSYDKMFDQLMPEAKAHIAFEELKVRQEFTDSDIDMVFDSLVGTESGDAQLGGAGSVAGKDEPTTSRAGALGAAQIMPGTGPEAAKLAGVPWDEAKFAYDAEYNKQLGKAYFKGQVDRFGDVRLALAAYNAGPTIMKDWMNGTNKSGKNDSGLKIGDPTAGELTVDEFVAQIPYAETRQYVDKTMSGSGVAMTNGMVSMSQAMEKSRDMDSNTATAFMGKVKNQNKLMLDARKADREQAGLSALTAIDNGQNPSAEDMMKLDETERNKINDHMEIQRGWAPLTAEEELARDVYFDSIGQEYSRNPDSIQDHSIIDLRTKLNPEDYETALKWRQIAADPDNTKNKISTATEGMVNNTISYTARQLNVFENKTKLGAFQREFRTRVLSFEMENKRKPNQNDLNDISDGLTQEVVLKNKGWFAFDSKESAYAAISKGELDSVIVPDTFLGEFMDEWRMAFGADANPPSDDTIREYYIRELEGK